MRDARKIVVVDLEATCWEGGRPPPGQVSEIIQIGLSVLDVKSLAIGETYGWTIRPELSEVSAFCTELTGIIPEVAARGIYFREAVWAIGNLRLRRYPWASWGDYDRRMLREACKRNCAAPFPFNPRHLNVKTLAALVLGLLKEPSLDAGLSALGLEPEGRAHDARWDAQNTARVLAGILRHARFSLTTKNPSAEIPHRV